MKRQTKGWLTNMKVVKVSEDNFLNILSFSELPLFCPHFGQGNHPLHLSGDQMDRSKWKRMKADEMDENIWQWMSTMNLEYHVFLYTALVSVHVQTNYHPVLVFKTGLTLFNWIKMVAAYPLVFYNTGSAGALFAGFRCLVERSSCICTLPRGGMYWVLVLGLVERPCWIILPPVNIFPVAEYYQLCTGASICFFSRWQQYLSGLYSSASVFSAPLVSKCNCLASIISSRRIDRRKTIFTTMLPLQMFSRFWELETRTIH